MRLGWARSHWNEMRTRGKAMDLSGSSNVGTGDLSTTIHPAGEATAPRKAKSNVHDSKSVTPLAHPVEVDHGRDALLTDFGKDTLTDRYLLPGESYQDLFVRVASAYADNADHAQRLYDYI